ncbi:putative oxidoreductase, SDR family [Nocardia nova SH22a]|uniref:Putative oxidoreductase, SDR family n=1 Tax=Nocardia nova SH22a TaxID=1415166 RepID=W5TMX4_9NOCA|nr:SDR family oxidoreductase [Nocardia nova]AHH18591.1 putative oxidoreductase, SDR family [Nocardia nova SH22a]
MGRLSGRVAVITGAGRGLGREHALLLAREGARVVVNDLGSAPDGTGADTSAAEAVVAEITALGGTALANTDDIATWDGAQRLIASAVDTFGDLHVLVNNAGILRDRMLVNMTEADWDSVMAVHLKGTFGPTRHAATFWRERAKAGHRVDASVVCTTSDAGLGNNVGQANYGTAKAGIAAFAEIAAKELGRYGVRVNAIAPGGWTRLAGLAGVEAGGGASADEFDPLDPANVSPAVAYLAQSDCPLTGCVLQVWGGEIGLFQGWRVVGRLVHDWRWTPQDLAAELPKLVSDNAVPDLLASEGYAWSDELTRRFGAPA